MKTYPLSGTLLSITRFAYGCMQIGGNMFCNIGSTNPERIAASCLADNIALSREEWYALLDTARGYSLP